MKLKLSKRNRNLLLGIFILLLILAFSDSTRSLVRGMVLPVAGGVRAVTDGLKQVWSKYVNLVGVAEENQRLKLQLQSLEGQLVRWRETATSVNRDPSPENGIGTAARIVGQDPHIMARTVMVDRGDRHGVKVGDVALFQEQLVGRVIRTQSGTSQVLLITDPRMEVSVLAQGSRAKGVLRGRERHLALNRDLWLTQGEYFDRQAQIHPGEILMTSGLDGLFPSGIPVGRVRSVHQDPTGLFQSAEVEPLVEPQKLERIWLRSYGS